MSPTTQSAIRLISSKVSRWPGCALKAWRASLSVKTTYSTRVHSFACVHIPIHLPEQNAGCPSATLRVECLVKLVGSLALLFGRLGFESDQHGMDQIRGHRHVLQLTGKGFED